MGRNNQKSNRWLGYALISLACHALVAILACKTFFLKKVEDQKRNQTVISAYFLRPQGGRGIKDEASNVALPMRVGKKSPKPKRAQKQLRPRLLQEPQEPIGEGIPIKDGDTVGDLKAHPILNNQIRRTQPMLVNGDQVTIPYPKKAKQLMVEGVVRLRLTIATDGKVIAAEIVSGPSFGLKDAALAMARKLFFLPATDERGQAKTAEIHHEVVFKLNKRS